jgi:hypothetical protein
MSYNVLADSLVAANIGLYQKVPPEWLEWTARQTRLVHEIGRHKVCHFFKKTGGRHLTPHGWRFTGLGSVACSAIWCAFKRWTSMRSLSGSSPDKVCMHGAPKRKAS